MNSIRKGVNVQQIKGTIGRDAPSTVIRWEKYEDTPSRGKVSKSLTSYVVKTASGKRNVLVLTTVVPIIGKTKDDGKQKPAIIKFYDYTKGGTDIVDQIMTKYSVKPKSAK